MYNTNINAMNGRACGCTNRSNYRSDVQGNTTTCERSRCGVGAFGSSWGLSGYPLASVYSPLQEFDNLYDCENALVRGTIFKELDLPFICGGM